MLPSDQRFLPSRAPFPHCRNLVDHPGERRYPPLMADSTRREPATGTDDETSRIHQLEEECRRLSERAEQADRELRSAKAEVEVKGEYVTAVEAELEETLAFLRTKTAYIESLPWIRLKIWFNGMRRR